MKNNYKTIPPLISYVRILIKKGCIFNQYIMQKESIVIVNAVRYYHERVVQISIDQQNRALNILVLGITTIIHVDKYI